MWQGQLGHAIALAVLVGAVYALRGAFDEGSFLGLSTATWAWLAVANAIAHQVYVWFCWRTELESRLVSRTVGFRAYAAVFGVLIALRPVLHVAVAWSNRGTLPIPPWLGYAITAGNGFTTAPAIRWCLSPAPRVSTCAINRRTGELATLLPS